MPIYARRKESQFDPAPEGLHAAVCVDVWDEWTEERPAEWGGGLMDKTRIVWMIEEANPKTNKPFEVSQIYTLSLHEKSNLCKHLEAWRGRKFSDEEKRGFDLEKLIGANCQLQVIHRVTEGGTYANVQAIVPPAKGAPRLSVPMDFVRHRDKKPKTAPTSTATEDDVDSVPF